VRLGGKLRARVRGGNLRRLAASGRRQQVPTRRAAPEAGSKGKEAGDGRHTIADGLGNFGAIEEHGRRGDHRRNSNIVRKEKA
jgi:hypothetical protein